MLRSCSYCGMIHPKGHVCPKKPVYLSPRGSKANRFRKSYAWQKKRAAVVLRDFHLCRVCNDGRYGLFGVPGLNSQLSVHHIEPLEENFGLRLSDDNLLTCCSRHHEMAEAGEIPRGYLHELARASPRWGSSSAVDMCQDQQRAAGHDDF